MCAFVSGFAPDKVLEMHENKYESQATFCPRYTVTDLLTPLISCLMSNPLLPSCPYQPSSPPTTTQPQPPLSAQAPLWHMSGLIYKHLNHVQWAHSFLKAKPQLPWPGPSFWGLKTHSKKVGAALISMIHTLMNDRSRNEDFLPKYDSNITLEVTGLSKCFMFTCFEAHNNFCHI